jgi:hypothetical protein
VSKKRQDERLVKLVSDVRQMRKEMHGLKHDLRVVAKAARKHNSPQRVPPINSL